MAFRRQRLARTPAGAAEDDRQFILNQADVPKGVELCDKRGLLLSEA
jgi:hypothetical protein